MGFHLLKTKGVLRREAASWLARLHSGRDPDIERKFRQWHDDDPRHAEAFGRVRRTYDQAGLLRHSSVASHPDLASRRQAGARPLPPRYALAAGVALAVLVPASVLFVAGVVPFGGTSAMVLVTRVGEIRQVDLADGSRVTLDSSTRMDVEIRRSRRTAHLRYGRARFQIAQASAPFVVETATATITARQGIIDVEQGSRQDRVQVLAGAADVRGLKQAPAAPVALGAGESMTVSSGGVERKGVAPSISDWTNGMLQFDATPLADAVTLANRYSKQHIILVGDLDALRVTGAFRAGDTLGLSKALAAAFGLSLQQRADGNLILSRSASPALQKKRGG